MLKQAKFYLRNFIRKQGTYKRILNELEKTQYYSEDEIIKLQNEKLQKIIHHCYKNVPYYKDLFDKLKLSPADIQTKQDLIKLPYMDKHVLRENFDNLKAKNIPKFLCSSGCSSGTTGTPVKVLRDYHNVNFENAILWRFWRNCGDSGLKRLTLKGQTILPLSKSAAPYWIYNYVNKELLMSCYHLTKDTALDYIKKIKDMQPEILYSYPSTAYLLAKYFQIHNEEFRFKAIFTTAELLRDDQRTLIESTFKCKIYDEYGQAERVSKITQCRHGNYHINEDYSIVEFLETSDGFELVGTSLNNFAMPLLRYKTGDKMEFTSEKCSCGSNFRVIKKICGRNSENFVFYAVDGIKVVVYDDIPRGINNIIETQFVQEKPDELIINIVTNDDFSEKDEHKLIANTQERILPKYGIIINKLGEIPKGPNGKFKNVLIKLIPEEKERIASNV